MVYGNLPDGMQSPQRTVRNGIGGLFPGQMSSDDSANIGVASPWHYVDADGVGNYQGVGKHIRNLRDNCCRVPISLK